MRRGVWLLAAVTAGSLAVGGAGAARAAEDSQDAVDAFGERFFVAEVTTELERRLLGNHDGPLDEASVCVFVDGREFAGDNQITAEARPFRLLAAYLEVQAQIDDRLVVIKVVDDVERGAFEAVKARSELLSKICEQIARDAGYRAVRATQTYGADLRENMDEAQAAVQREEAAAQEGERREEPAGRTMAGNDRLRVYAVHTYLERLLAGADCVVDVRPVLRETPGNRFPDDFVAELDELMPQVEFAERRAIQFEIHHIESVQEHVMAWINDRQKRTALAERFGFEACKLSMSLTSE